MPVTKQQKIIQHLIIVMSPSNDILCQCLASYDKMQVKAMADCPILLQNSKNCKCE